MCLFCTIACGVWETLTGDKFRMYLPWPTLVPNDPVAGATVISLLVFFSYAIVLNTVVPISLYVRYPYLLPYIDRQFNVVLKFQRGSHSSGAQLSNRLGPGHVLRGD